MRFACFILSLFEGLVRGGARGGSCSPSGGLVALWWPRFILAPVVFCGLRSLEGMLSMRTLSMRTKAAMVITMRRMVCLPFARQTFTPLVPRRPSQDLHVRFNPTYDSGRVVFAMLSSPRCMFRLRRCPGDPREFRDDRAITNAVGRSRTGEKQIRALSRLPFFFYSSSCRSPSPPEVLSTTKPTGQ